MCSFHREFYDRLFWCVQQLAVLVGLSSNFRCGPGRCFLYKNIDCLAPPAQTSFAPSSEPLQKFFDRRLSSNGQLEPLQIRNDTVDFCLFYCFSFSGHGIYRNADTSRLLDAGVLAFSSIGSKEVSSFEAALKTSRSL